MHKKHLTNVFLEKKALEIRFEPYLRGGHFCQSHRLVDPFYESCKIAKEGD